MYHIDKEKDKPDIGYLEATVEQLMQKGIRLADCSKLHSYYTGLKEALKVNIQTKYNIENPNSPKQVTEYLDMLSRKVDLKSKNDIINICYNDETNKWTSKESALSKLVDLGYEFAQDILDYRHIAKYAESIQGIMNAADSNNLIHPRVSLAKTNRIQYSEPGLLTIPKKLLWHVIAPYTEGNILYSIDIKNQEPNILINMTGAKELIPLLESEDGLYVELFRKCFRPVATANVLIDTFPDNRLYTIPEIKAIGTISPAMYLPVKPSISDVFYKGERVVEIETVCIGSSKGMRPQLPETVDVETELGNIYSVKVTWVENEKNYKRSADYTVEGYLDELDITVGKVERKEFKRAWNAISYGASFMGVSEICKIIDPKRTYGYITKIAELKEYRTRVEKLAKSGGTTIKTIFGTNLNAGFADNWRRLQRILLDLPIQGSGADILSLLVKHFYEYVEEKGLKDKLTLYYTRHDELIVEADSSWVSEIGDEKVKAILTDMLEHQINDWTPFKVDVERVKTENLGIELDDDEEDVE